MRERIIFNKYNQYECIDIKGKKLNTNRPNGITLIALVVTIIVLLILAGVTIITLFGDNGLINMADKARGETANSQANDIAGIGSLGDQMNTVLNGSSTGGGTGDVTPPVEIATLKDNVAEKNTPAKDAKGNIVTVPKGFKIAADSGSTVQDGIVIEDSAGNQFVWIPVGEVTLNDGTTKKQIKLGRYNFDLTTGEPIEVQLASNYQAEIGLRPNNWDEYQIDVNGDPAVTKELVTSRPGVASSGTDGENATAKNLAGFVGSVQANGGYYIARYEASRGGDNKVQSKSGEAWTNITQIDAASAARNMYREADNVGVESDLINSYAWDTAIVYIQEMGNDNFANLTCADLMWNWGSATASPRIEDKFCNIYDMVANVSEWTTEYSSNTNGSNAIPCVSRGGNYNDRDYYTSSRYYKDTLATTTRTSGRTTMRLSVATSVFVHFYM